MDTLRFTLVADGTSDFALLPILRWVLARTGSARIFLTPDERPVGFPPGEADLATRIRDALERYPCDLLFVHRDAERQEPRLRYEEIAAALTAIEESPPAVCVVPVRMTEAWLLSSEAAIRRAADNPNGKMPLHLPPTRTLEELPDPKQTLIELLRTACDLSGRHLHRFKRDEARRRFRVAELTDDFSPLIGLTAFDRLRDDVYELVEQNGWL